MLYLALYQTQIANELVNQHIAELNNLHPNERNDYIKEIVEEEFYDLAYDITNTEFIKSVITELTGSKNDYNSLSTEDQKIIKDTFLKDVESLVKNSYDTFSKI